MRTKEVCAASGGAYSRVKAQVLACMQSKRGAARAVCTNDFVSIENS